MRNNMRTVTRCRMVPFSGAGRSRLVVRPEPSPCPGDWAAWAFLTTGIMISNEGRAQHARAAIGVVYLGVGNGWIGRAIGSRAGLSRVTGGADGLHAGRLAA